MKTKQINRVLITGLTFLLIITALFTFSACKDKEFKPKDISIEQAQTLLDEAFTNISSNNNIYSKYIENGEVLREYIANSSQYYEIDTDEQVWYVNNSGIWCRYCYDANTQSGHVTQDIQCNYTSALEEFMSNIDFILDIEITSAKQTEENEYTIVIEEDAQCVSIRIINSKIVSFTGYGFDDYIIEQTIEYNTAKTIPEIPEIEWEHY